MKVLVDMNLSPRWVPLLSEASIHAIHWASVGDPGASDAEIMRHAQRNGYVVLTHDLDFAAILAARRESGPSVIQLRTNDVRPEVIGSMVLTAMLQMEPELARGALVTVDLLRTRVRILPLTRS